ncbi:hypothetical protein SYNPS1DRAFT_26905 [Syncephalis pseudoplumigaleata]|uniref:PH domain-containing protein n=1 Tax=Syncephalis pseudoplumigaleata TaxID=1712513 RepID=A0A4P9Z4D8_9FUNG|nr:hypothetical protein SYNPS1DRAFT_26905 [Syncephalis pseudoplumigaleata]|eukprot:RKP27434.1 hypothetical protein SYNPS1DRAFT_26905 [Syncephalis pseudoplumigaleata]
MRMLHGSTAPHTPAGSMRRIDSSIHPEPKPSTSRQEQQQQQQQQQQQLVAMASPAASAPATMPAIEPASPASEQAGQSPQEAVAEDGMPAAAPAAGALCHLMLLRVDRVHPHNMPDVYHQGIAIFTSLHSVQWRQVVGQLDGLHLSFHQPSSPSSPVPGKALYSLELASYHRVKLGFFSPLDGSLALSLVSQAKEDMVEVFIMQLKEHAVLQQWYARLEGVVERKLSWDEQMMAGRDPCQLLQRPDIAAAVARRPAAPPSGRASHRRRVRRGRGGGKRGRKHAQLRGRHAADTARPTATDHARSMDPALKRPLSLIDRHITQGMLSTTGGTAIHEAGGHRQGEQARRRSIRRSMSQEDGRQRRHSRRSDKRQSTTTLSAAVSQMAAIGIAPMVVLATPTHAMHDARPSTANEGDVQSAEGGARHERSRRLPSTHDAAIRLMVEVPDIGSRVEIVLDSSGSDPAAMPSYARLRTLVLDTLMGRRAADHCGDTPREAMERRKQLAALWQYWNEGEVGLAWRRWHRLEWPPAEAPISVARLLERTHTLELRRTSHYGRFIDTASGATLNHRVKTPPPDVEGCLLRVFTIRHALATFMTRQRKHASVRRFYLATRGQFLFITTPSRLPLPQFTMQDGGGSSGVVRQLLGAPDVAASDEEGGAGRVRMMPRLAGAMVDLLSLVRVDVAAPSAEERENQSASTADPSMASSRRAGEHGTAGRQHGRPRQQQHRQRRVELVFRNDHTLSLLATDERSALEWQRRLQAIAQYWRQYHDYEQALRRTASVAAGAFTHHRRLLERRGEQSHDDTSGRCIARQEHHLPSARNIGAPEDYETGPAMVDTRLWPVCTSLGCEFIVRAGLLYRKTARRQPAIRLFCVLTSDGYLCYFDAPSSSAVQLTRGRTRLTSAYVYSRCRDREAAHRRPRASAGPTTIERHTSRYIGEGIYTRDSLLDCSFSLWLPSRHQYFWHTNGQRGHGVRPARHRSMGDGTANGH